MKHRNAWTKPHAHAWIYHLAVVALMMFFAHTPEALAQGQWTTSGNNINNTNPGNVGVGTTNPLTRLHVRLDPAGTPPTLYPTQHDMFMLEGTAPIMQFLTGQSGEGWIEWSRAGASPLRGAAGIGYSNVDGSMRFVTGNDGTFAPQFHRMVINASGNVGVGTSAPAYKLDVQGGQINASGGLCIAGVCKTDWSQVGGTSGGGTSQWTTSGANIFYNAGNVGIGTTTPGARLDVGVGATARGGYSDVLVGPGGNNPQIELYGPTKSSAISHDEAMGGMVLYTNGPLFAPSLFVGNSGNVGVGTTSPTSKLHVQGDITATGNIAAKYQDLAEWVPARAPLAAGTVVVLDTEQSNQVMASTKAYDLRVAGVVSAAPGVLLGERGEGKVMVATTGRVRVKVDATRAPVRIGDVLVTSEREGMAMRSEPLDFGGTPIHRPGTLIGKALEPLANGIGEVLVLLSLQ